MNEAVQISSVTLTVFGSIITLMLTVIAFFLNRLVGQFDKLQQQFSELNTTMNRIDKDLSGDVGVLKSRMQEFDPVWERLRTVETAMVSIQSGGCEYYHSRIHSQ